MSIASTSLKLLEWIKNTIKKGMIISKQKKAELIIEKYKLLTPINGRYTNEMIKAKEDFYISHILYIIHIPHPNITCCF